MMSAQRTIQRPLREAPSTRGNRKRIIWALILAAAILVLVLLFRPQGILGKRAS